MTLSWTVVNLYGLMTTLEINMGRKQKIRPGDILGALTGDGGLAGENIGKIDVLDMVTFVAVENGIAKQALNYLEQGKVKGKTVKARFLV